jgi:hypothetical protein
VFIALATLNLIELNKFSFMEKAAVVQHAEYATNLAGKTYPTLLFNGKYISDSDVIIKLLIKNNLVNFVPDNFTFAQLKDFVAVTSLNLRNSIQYYYKLYFSASIVNNNEKANLAQTTQNQANSPQKNADIIEEFIKQIKVDGLAQQDLYIYPEVSQYISAQSLCKFSLGVATMQYIDRIHSRIKSLVTTTGN